MLKLIWELVTTVYIHLSNLMDVFLPEKLVEKELRVERVLELAQEGRGSPANLGSRTHHEGGADLEREVPASFSLIFTTLDYTICTSYHCDLFCKYLEQRDQINLLFIQHVLLLCLIFETEYCCTDKFR
jgi:hypothetical protein